MTHAELRDIDARIHREVMGLPVHTDKATGVHFQDTDHYQFVPHYSSSIAAAWQVVERMCGPDYMVARFDHGGGTTRCGFYTVHAGSLIAFASGETAPLAICLAALKAVSPKET